MKEKEQTMATEATDTMAMEVAQAMKSLDALRRVIEPLCTGDRATQIEVHKAVNDVAYYLSCLQMDCTHVDDEVYASEDYQAECMKY
jgi:hypothetical protein